MAYSSHILSYVSVFSLNDKIKNSLPIKSHKEKIYSLYQETDLGNTYTWCRPVYEFL